MVVPGSYLRLYGLMGLLGAQTAVRRDARARLLGIPFPGTTRQQALTIGTAVSAPAALLVAAAAGGRRIGDRRAAALAAVFLGGAIGEPESWRTLRRPSVDPLLTAIVAANIAVPAAALLAARSAFIDRIRR